MLILKYYLGLHSRSSFFSNKLVWLLGHLTIFVSFFSSTCQGTLMLPLYVDVSSDRIMGLFWLQVHHCRKGWDQTVLSQL
jgi:hypothetical protein